MTDRAHRLLLVLLALGVLVTLPRAGAGLARSRCQTPVAPVRVDLWQDPPAHLQLLRGIGPARAARIVAVRTTDPEAPRLTRGGLLLRALGKTLAQRVGASPLLADPRRHR